MGYVVVVDRFELDREQINPSRSGGGPIHMTASLGDGARLHGYVIVSASTEPDGTQMETMEARQLFDDGRAHIQV